MRLTYWLKMAKQVNVSGLEAYLSAVEENEKITKSLFALFTSTPNANGESWCPDCVAAEPVIEKNIPKLPNDAVLINCKVGDRQTWKDPNNAFRTHPSLALKSIPTLMRVGKPQRLAEEQCADSNLVEMLFTED